MDASDDTSGQLLEMQGTFRLCHPLLPDLGCLLTEFIESGCRGSVMFQYLPHDVVVRWRKCLTPQHPVRVKLTSLAQLGPLELDACVVGLDESAHQWKIDVRFTHLTPDQAAMLEQARAANGPPAVRPPPPPVQSAPPAPVPDAPPPARPEAVPSALLARSASPATPPSAAAAPPQDQPAQPVAAPPAGKRAALSFDSFPPPPPDEPGPHGPAPFSGPPSRPAPVAFASSAPPPPYQPRAPAPVRATPPGRPPAQPEAPPVAAPASSPPLVTRKRVGAMLVQMSKLTAQQAEEAAAQARASGERLGQYLVRTGKISAGALCRALALQSGLPMTDLADADIPEKLARLFPYALMARHGFVPFDDAGSFVCIAAANPLAPAAIKELQETCHRNVEVFLAREDLIARRLEALHPKSNAQQQKSNAVPRKFIRYDVSLPVLYQFCTRLGAATDPTQYRGLSLNISEGGLSIEGPPTKSGQPADLLRVGTCVRITMAPDTPQQMSAVCRLKVIQPKGPFWMMGLEVSEASTEDRRRLKELCVHAMMGHMKSPDAP